MNVRRSGRLVALALALVAAGTATAAGSSRRGLPSQAELQALLMRPGDLPSGFAAGQVRARPPAMFNGLPAAAVTATRQFSRNGQVAGGVSVFVYRSAAVVDRAYSRVLADMGRTRPYPTLNRSARFATVALLPAIDFAFKRCTTLVHIRMSGTGDPDDAGSYAVRLNRRLASHVC